MSDESSTEILVRVQPIGPTGRQVGGHDPADALSARSDDIKRGVAAGVGVVSESIAAIKPAAGWSVDSVDATFGITLGAEGSVIVSKASVEASFEITVSFRRDTADTTQSAPG